MPPEEEQREGRDDGGSSPSFSLQSTERSNSITNTSPDFIRFPTVSVQCNSDEVVTGCGFAQHDPEGNLERIDPNESKKLGNGWTVTMAGAAIGSTTTVLRNV